MRRPRDTGIALITTLWVIAVLSILITAYLYETRLDWRISRGGIEKTQAEYAAKAGIAQFQAVLDDDDDAYDDAEEDWGQGVNGQMEDPAGTGKTFSYTVSAADMNALIDVNSADETILSSLLQSAGVPDETRSSLAQNIVSARDERPFLTPGDLARVEGMTNAILYGAPVPAAEGEEAEQTTPLINLISVYSVDKNEQSNGNSRTNITSADANTLRQDLTNSSGEEILSQNEASAVVSYRDSNEFESIGDLFDVPAITQETLDNVRDQLTTGNGGSGNSGGGNGNGNGNGGGGSGNGNGGGGFSSSGDETTNINTANAETLANVDGLDQGTAEAIVRYRDENGNYSNVDDIQNAPVFTRDEIRQIADKIAITDDQTLRGVLNLNTAGSDALSLLPGMDGGKAQAIVNRRQAQQTQQGQGGNRSNNQGGAEAVASSNPFRSVGDLLNIDNIDEDTFKQIANLVTYRTQAFRLTASGMDSNGKEAATVTAIIDRSGEEISVRYWRVE